MTNLTRAQASALASTMHTGRASWRWPLVILAVFFAVLFYGFARVYQSAERYKAEIKTQRVSLPHSSGALTSPALEDSFFEVKR